MATAASPLLQSIQILVTGVEEKEKRQLHALAKGQGAVVLSTANANDPPHVIITRTVGSPRYFAILRRNAKTPAVTPEWLTSCIEQCTRLPYADFAAGTFQGLVICFSGLPIPEKRELGKEVELQGARHSLSLDRRCTHLVTDSTQSEKFLFAQLHGITCVTPEWVGDSLEAGRCMDPAKYLVTQQTISQQQRQSQLTKQTSLSRHVERDDGDGTVSAIACDQISKGDGSFRSVKDDPSMLPDPSTNSLQRLASGDVALPPPLKEPNPFATTPAAAVPWATLECDDDAPMFLESCFIWVVGCTPAEEQETLELCAKGGAKRFLELHPVLTTHVVVGTQIDDLHSVSEFVVDHRDVAVVGMEWLRRSVARQEMLPADERFTVALGTGAGRKAGGKLGNSNVAVLTGKGYTTNESNSLGGGGGAAAGDGNLSNNGGGGGGGGTNTSGAPSLLRHPSSASLMGGFLDGYYFTLAAMRGTPEGDAAERLIRSNGGRIFSASMPSNGRGCFAICPYSLPQHKIHSLIMNSPDFAAVPDSNRFTIYWLECCVQVGEVLPPQAGTTCFQPLPYPLPIPGMDKISVAISGYDSGVRSAIQRTIEIVGGKVSLEYMTSKDTHLIVPVAAGKKYRNAARFGVIPVTGDWLVASVTAGKVLPPDNFAPLLPTGGLPAPLDAADASSLLRPGPAPSQIGPSQTQLPGAAPGVTSLYEAAIGGNSMQIRGAPTQKLTQSKPLGQTNAGGNGEAGPNRAPSLRERAKRLAAAAQRVIPPVAPRQPRPAFDFESLMGPPPPPPPTGAASTSAATAVAAATAMAGLVAAREPLAASAFNPIFSIEPPKEAVREALPPPAGPSCPPPRFDNSNTNNKMTSNVTKVMPRAATKQLNSEIQDDGGELVAQVTSLLGKIRDKIDISGALEGGQGSQQEMPPPASRTTGPQGASARGRSRGKRARQESYGTIDDSTGGVMPRRSGRRGASSVAEAESEGLGLEMSQQVGYETAHVEVGEMAAVAGARAAKERLTRAATRQRRGLANKDLLEGL